MPKFNPGDIVWYQARVPERGAGAWAKTWGIVWIPSTMPDRYLCAFFGPKEYRGEGGNKGTFTMTVDEEHLSRIKAPLWAKKRAKVWIRQHINNQMLDNFTAVEMMGNWQKAL